MPNGPKGRWGDPTLLLQIVTLAKLPLQGWRKIELRDHVPHHLPLRHGTLVSREAPAALDCGADLEADTRC